VVVCCEIYKAEVLYNGGEPRTFSYAEIVESLKLRIFSRQEKDLLQTRSYYTQYSIVDEIV
jgi:hypothetical protein